MDIVHIRIHIVNTQERIAAKFVPQRVFLVTFRNLLVNSMLSALNYHEIPLYAHGPVRLQRQHRVNQVPNCPHPVSGTGLV